MEPKTTNVPPPEDEEEIRYIYNRGTQTLHKWPGCAALDRMGDGNREYWTSAQLGEYRLEHGVIRRCKLCFLRPARR